METNGTSGRIARRAMPREAGVMPEQPATVDPDAVTEKHLYLDVEEQAMALARELADPDFAGDREELMRQLSEHRAMLPPAPPRGPLFGK